MYDSNMSTKVVWSIRVDKEDLEQARKLGLSLSEPIRQYMKLLVWKHSPKAKQKEKPQWKIETK